MSRPWYEFACDIWFIKFSFNLNLSNKKETEIKRNQANQDWKLDSYFQQKTKKTVWKDYTEAISYNYRLSKWRNRIPIKGTQAFLFGPIPLPFCHPIVLSSIATRRWETLRHRRSDVFSVSLPSSSHPVKRRHWLWYSTSNGIDPRSSSSSPQRPRATHSASATPPSPNLCTCRPLSTPPSTTSKAPLRLGLTECCRVVAGEHSLSSFVSIRPEDVEVQRGGIGRTAWPARPGGVGSRQQIYRPGRLRRRFLTAI